MIIEEKEPLIHYASKYYDPVKAHEYYIRTRELKGRSTSRLSDEGKKIWGYTKNQITDEKNKKLEEEKENSDKEIEDLRSAANEMRERISEKLYELNEVLSKSASEQKTAISTKKDEDIQLTTEAAKGNREAIDARTERRINAIRQQPIPIGLTKEQRRKFIAERNAKIAKITGEGVSEKAKITSSEQEEKLSIRGKAKEDTAKVSEETSEGKASNRKDAAAQRKEVSNALKDAVKAAREAYKQVKTGINESYEEIYNQEYGKVLQAHGKTKNGKKSSSIRSLSNNKPTNRQKSERASYKAKVTAASVREKLDAKRN